jgi:hypothetical protein
MTKPQWLPENSISGCKQLIHEYWVRENAMKIIDIDTVNNYTNKDDYQSSRYSTNPDYSKYDRSQPHNSHVQSSTISHVESCDQSSSYSHSESFSRSSSQSRIKSRSKFCNESDIATSSQHSGDQILLKVNKKVNDYHVQLN